MRCGICTCTGQKEKDSKNIGFGTLVMNLLIPFKLGNYFV
jgi:hypothetical protein